jgi:hypothetical protein
VRATRTLRATGRSLPQRRRIIDDAALVAAAEAGVAGLLRRSDASADTMVRTILTVASGDGQVLADLLGWLLEQVGRLQRQVLPPRGLTSTGLTPRETGDAHVQLPPLRRRRSQAVVDSA